MRGVTPHGDDLFPFEIGFRLDGFFPFPYENGAVQAQVGNGEII